MESLLGQTLLVLIKQTEQHTEVGIWQQLASYSSGATPVLTGQLDTSYRSTLENMPLNSGMGKSWLFRRHNMVRKVTKIFIDLWGTNHQRVQPWVFGSLACILLCDSYWTSLLDGARQHCRLTIWKYDWLKKELQIADSPNSDGLKK